MISDVVKDTPFELFVFGSRINGKARPTSDLDLAYYGPQPFLEIDQLEEAFFESDLPFTVDIIDLNTCSQEFLEMIQEDLTPLKPLL